MLPLLLLKSLRYECEARRVRCATSFPLDPVSLSLSRLFACVARPNMKVWRHRTHV